MPAYNNTLGVVFVKIRLYFHGKKCLSSQKKTFLFVRVIRCVQAVRHQVMRIKLLNNKAHRVTEGTEVNAISWRCQWHKE